MPVMLEIVSCRLIVVLISVHSQLYKITDLGASSSTPSQTSLPLDSSGNNDDFSPIKPSPFPMVVPDPTPRTSWVPFFLRRHGHPNACRASFQASFNHL
ncbi:hypothetical protein GALMADRAFT_246703 [Galerina marginata CBS 339.88]|uniref:Secreted protein n=1 Tax=Galerina marginata (strain CBS 339.88) TaxID=685588 RepID=A0A067T4R0_GALM3|nr:hypothetical protein GALMADRAFT_246703 [Galerina marginata CBS 339.88]